MPQHPVPIRKNWGLPPSWSWLLLQSALGWLKQLSLLRLSWDSFARALLPTSPSRVHSRLHSEPTVLAHRQSLHECRPRQLATTLAASSILVVSHHLDGLLRVTASDVLQSEPARVRCVSSPTDPLRLASQTRRHERRTFPAARAPYEEPSSYTGGHISRCTRYPREVAAQMVQTRRPFPSAWPSSGLYSVHDPGLSRFPLPVR